MLARPERFFEERFGLTPSTMERLLGSTLAQRVDHADLYLEYRVSEELSLEEGAVKKAARHVSQGAGIRAQSGERTGYAHTDDLSLPNLEEAARQARAIADRAGGSAVVAVGRTGAPHDLYSLPEPPIAADLQRKLSITVIVEEDGKREIGGWGGGGRVALDFFEEGSRWERFAS